MNDEKILHRQFEMLARNVRILAEPLLEVHFGSRCPEHSDHCPNCDRWDLLDRLLENPYEVNHETSV